MLDSLVRVSRRVGWKADKLASDPEHTTPASPAVTKRAVVRHGCPVPDSRTPQEDEVATKANAVVPRLRNGRPHRVYNSPVPKDQTYLPQGLVAAATPVEALCPRKVHTAELGRTPPSSREGLERRCSQPRAELSSASRLCRSTRLPLNGFTYS